MWDLEVRLVDDVVVQQDEVEVESSRGAGIGPLSSEVALDGQ